jgi:putative membrane protein
MWWGIHEGFGWWMVMGGLGMVLFWGAIIGLVVWGILTLSRGRHDSGPIEDPAEIAGRRYARGEITREQFEEIRDTLRHRSGRS